MIHASGKRVWDVITKSELVKQWQYGSDLLTDWQIGSEIRFHSEWEGKVYEQWGKVLEFEPYKFIKYTLFAPRPDLEDKPENYFIMSYTLTEEGNETLLSFTRTFHSADWQVFAAEGEISSASYFAITEDKDHKPNGNLIGFQSARPIMQSISKILVRINMNWFID